MGASYSVESFAQLGEGAWRVLVHDEPTAAAQMRFDEQLALEGTPILRLFRWAVPALSWGYRQSPPSWVDSSACGAVGVELVERPTGGGLAVHGTDLSCSAVVPRRTGVSLRRCMASLCELFAQRCRWCDVMVEWDLEARARHRVAYCLTEASPYALMVGDRKLGGFAARAYAGSWLIQGSLLIQPVSEAIRRIMPKSVQFDYDTKAIGLEEAVGGPIDETALIDALKAASSERQAASS